MLFQGSSVNDDHVNQSCKSGNGRKKKSRFLPSRRKSASFSTKTSPLLSRSIQGCVSLPASPNFFTGRRKTVEGLFDRDEVSKLSVSSIYYCFNPLSAGCGVYST